jgi:hypothetical protein
MDNYKHVEENLIKQIQLLIRYEFSWVQNIEILLIVAHNEKQTKGYKSYTSLHFISLAATQLIMNMTFSFCDWATRVRFLIKAWPFLGAIASRPAPKSTQKLKIFHLCVVNNREAEIDFDRKIHEN